MSTAPVTITHGASGAACTVYPFGAHVTSYKTASGRELLFLSRDAKLDGTKAIRGGIPLCFPQFGQPDKAMPQHGFLRNNLWKEVEGSRYDNNDSAGISFEIALKDAVNSRGGKWSADTNLDVRCTYTVTIAKEGFETTIEMENTGTESWPFQVLLHNYLLVGERSAMDEQKCNVKGLDGYAVLDQITGEEYVLGAEPVTAPNLNVDRIYTPPDGQLELNLNIVAGPSNNISLTAHGEVDGKKVPASCVVWNPHKEKAEAMSDFGSDQYVDMLCVEPGLLSGLPAVEGGKKASFTQEITSLDA